jgi:Ca-activated chloride channel family protein
MVQPPTTDQDALETAIASLTLGRGTAVGSGIMKAIDVVAEIDPNIAPSVKEDSPFTPPTPVPEGAYAPAIIVVLTDGVSTTGYSPIDAAQQAADRGLRVYTIGFGTENGGIFGGQGGGPFGGQGGGQFSGFRRGIDEATMKQVAEMTGGEYYVAESANELQQVFADLPTSLITRHEVTEISVIFSAIGALLAALAIGLAMRWNPLP